MPDMKSALTQHVQEQNPNGIPPIAAIAARARRRRSRHRLVLLGAASAAAGVLVAGVVMFQPAQQQTAQDANKARVAAPSAQDQPTGEVPVEGTFACTRGSSVPETVITAGFAFDGTITKIEPASADDGFDDRIVTFSVAEWFSGGEGDTVTVTMYRPKEDTPPSYGVGSHLLVSGGHGDGTYMAWPCGRTQYYDPDTAKTWRRLTQ